MKCDLCFEVIEKDPIKLECDHQFHKKCLYDYLVAQNGDESMDVLRLDKTKLVNMLFIDEASDEILTMVFAEEHSGMCLMCPHVMHTDPTAISGVHSMANPLYRIYGILKKIKKIIVFEDKIKLYHHICTNVDLLHYMDKSKQSSILNDPNFNARTHEIIVDPMFEQMLKSVDYVVHANIYENKFKLMPESECGTCLNYKDYVHSDIKNYMKAIYGI